MSLWEKKIRKQHAKTDKRIEEQRRARQERILLEQEKERARRARGASEQSSSSSSSSSSTADSPSTASVAEKISLIGGANITEGDKKPTGLTRSLSQYVPRQRNLSSEVTSGATTATATGLTTFAAGERCLVCGKRVYLNEKLSADGKIFHKVCFTCAYCKSKLTLGNYSFLSGKYYCKPHFKQLFKLKGDYTSGFAAVDDSPSLGDEITTNTTTTPPTITISATTTSASDLAPVVASSSSSITAPSPSVAVQLPLKKDISVSDNPASRSNSVIVTKTDRQGAQTKVTKLTSGPGERCLVCSKRVYVKEKLSADGKIFHKTCFKCKHCKRQLSLGDYSFLEGSYYCKPHFKQLFKLKGDYTSGFNAGDDVSW